jgi:ribosomal protein L12E/L44/L45/RPP1/RPP2
VRCVTYSRSAISRLARLRGDDEFQRMVARAGLVVSNVGVVAGMTGKRLQRLMAMWQEQVAALAEPAAIAAHARQAGPAACHDEAPASAP